MESEETKAQLKSYTQGRTNLGILFHSEFQPDTSECHLLCGKTDPDQSLFIPSDAKHAVQVS